MVTPAAKRKAVAHLKDGIGMSERRACKAMGCCRMTIRYETARGDDRDLRERMKAMAQERRRFGYRRLHVLLRREGHRREPQETLPALSGGEAGRAQAWRPEAGDRHAGADAGPDGANERWSLDFVSDQLTDGRRFRILAVVDDCTRECLATRRRYLAVGPAGCPRT